MGGDGSRGILGKGGGKELVSKACNAIPSKLTFRPDPNAPKPNKRFLASMIKSVDGHNKALLKEQARSAKDARTMKGGGSGMSRLFGGAMKGAAKDAERAGRRDRERNDGRRDDRARRHDYDDRRSRRRDDQDYDRRQDRSPDLRDRRRSRSRSRSTSRDREPLRDRSRDRYDRRERDRSPQRRSRRDRSRSIDRNDRRKRDSSRDRERRRDRDRDRDHVRERSRDRKDRRDRSREREDRRDRSPKRRSRTNDKRSSDRQRRPRPPSSSPPPPPPPDSPPAIPSHPISRMDKYFKQDYDPRLDVGPVPKEGIVADVGWDNMLAVLKERGQKVSYSHSRDQLTGSAAVTLPASPLPPSLSGSQGTTQSPVGAAALVRRCRQRTRGPKVSSTWSTRRTAACVRGTWASSHRRSVL